MASEIREPCQQLTDKNVCEPWCHWAVAWVQTRARAKQSTCHHVLFSYIIGCANQPQCRPATPTDTETSSRRYTYPPLELTFRTPATRIWTSATECWLIVDGFQLLATGIHLLVGGLDLLATGLHLLVSGLGVLDAHGFPSPQRRPSVAYRVPQTVACRLVSSGMATANLTSSLQLNVCHCPGAEAVCHSVVIEIAPFIEARRIKLKVSAVEILGDTRQWRVVQVVKNIDALLKT